MDATKFARPPKEYREVPFWSWNDELSPAELRRQIGLMEEGGWGGFFMHSRIGLKTPYLGKRWMECVRACVDEARQRGMGAWLYDEDKWPSGYAGGLAAVDPAHRAQALVCLVDNKPARLVDGLAMFVANRDEQGRLSDFAPPGDLTVFDGDRQSLVQFYLYTVPLGQGQFKGYTYINTLNPAAVRAFLDATHEVYAREFQGEFGRAIPGIFTDEPAYLSMNIPEIGVMGPGEIQAVPWVQDLPQAFRLRWGYDLIENLPGLFFDEGPYTRTRYHFWRLVTERFVDAFTKQIYEWCEEHHLPLTGHYLLEDNLYVQTRWIGAAMPHYEYEHIPGIDKLARNLYTVLTVKQLDSAVCQLGKPRALCESYGCAGQDTSFAGRKWIGDWLYVLGVNLNNPHLSLYSMRGERKRDYPANLFFQQAWWPENRLIADYFSRLSYALSQGQRVVDVLVLHPIGSAWSRYRPDSTASVEQIDAGLTGLEQALLTNQRDFHYGDELLMEKYARVNLQGPFFEVGRMRYKAVIVPPSHTWSANTTRLLHEFASAGGLILAVPPLPTEIDGQHPSAAGVQPAPVTLPSTVRVVPVNELADLLAQCLPADVRIEAAPEVWYHHRRDGEQDWFFLCNTSLDRCYRTRVQIHGTGRLEEWDLTSGCISPLAAHLAPAGPGGAEPVQTVELDFSPSGSHLLVLHHNLPQHVSAPLENHVRNAAHRLDTTWNLHLDSPNCITLDRAAVWKGDEWTPPLYILDAHAQVRAAGPGFPFHLRFAVQVDEIPPDPVFLVVETPWLYTLTVNGELVDHHESETWLDAAFQKMNISGKLRRGENEIILAGNYTSETELESIYLLGEFGVCVAGGELCGAGSGQTFFRYHPEFSIARLPQSAQSGNLVGQGLPFFTGRVELSQKIHLDQPAPNAMLHLQGPYCAVARVSVNGKAAGLSAWPPYEITLGDLLDTGENTLTIELVSTLRNLLGPHHLRQGDGEEIGPDSFRRTPDWTDDYVFAPFGLDGGEIRW